MQILQILTKFDNLLRPLVLKLPSYIPVLVYSYGRKFFLNQLFNSIPAEKVILPPECKQEYLGLEFQSNLFNAAGIFKEVYGYELCYRQGAGAFLVGTITPKPRIGNVKYGIKHPFIPLQRSKAAINWMGLPNVGIDEALKRIKNIEKKSGCPIGISISSQPDSEPVGAIQELNDTFLKIEHSQVDFIELNESCPNVAHSHSEERVGKLDKSLVDRLEILSKKFLIKRKKKLPVIVKFSNDIDPEQVEELIQLLVNLKFDGINFGNTSINYSKIREQLNPIDLRNFDYFKNHFGGGVSGAVLREKSLNLCRIAAAEFEKIANKSDFLVIRTGGIDSKDDIKKSNEIGVNLNQWFTGYFETFSKYGNNCYLNVLSK